MNLSTIFEEHIRKFWIHYSIILGSFIIAMFTGFFQKIGEMWAGHWDKRRKEKITQVNIAKAYDRGDIVRFLNTALTEVHKSNDDLKAEVKSVRKKVETLQIKIDECQEEKSNLGKKVGEFLILVPTMRHEIATLTTRLAKYEKP
jgi:hypothetical protein